jgi:hypothetical protein
MKKFSIFQFGNCFGHFFPKFGCIFPYVLVTLCLYTGRQFEATTEDRLFIHCSFSSSSSSSSSPSAVASASDFSSSSRSPAIFWISLMSSVAETCSGRCKTSVTDSKGSGWKPTHLTSVNICIRTSAFIASWYYANALFC